MFFIDDDDANVFEAAETMRCGRQANHRFAVVDPFPFVTSLRLGESGVKKLRLFLQIAREIVLRAEASVQSQAPVPSPCVQFQDLLNGSQINFCFTTSRDALKHK